LTPYKLLFYLNKLIEKYKTQAKKFYVIFCSSRKQILGKGIVNLKVRRAKKINLNRTIELNVKTGNRDNIEGNKR